MSKVENNIMKIIGLTGGIGSGKSTVSAYLRQKGISILDADAIVAAAEAKGSPQFPAIVKILGKEVLTADGELDRPKVSTLVFSHPEKLKALNAIVYACVEEARKKLLNEKKSEKLVVFDIPLLIECRWNEKVDEVWLVAVDTETQIARAMARSGLSREEVEKRIKRQMPLQEKKQYADLILDNSGSLENLYKQVDAALNKIES
jgi:dephospho-CoA kinase